MPVSIGERIKGLRTERGMTLADLGEKVKLSTSYLSQIERDKTTPSLSTLLDIAKALNVGPRYFFEIEAEAAYILRAGKEQDNLTSDSPIVRLHLTPDARTNKLDVYRVQLEPHTSLEQLDPFSGEELGFVLSGELTVEVGDDQYVLGAGDSIHYDASQPYYWINAGDQPCLVIWGRAASSLERLP
jgi:transcriptional regulator with XRE-family HTH domain